MSSGRFITFEGGEGAGKSTQLSLLAEALRGLVLDPLETREPGGSPGAEEIRELLIHGAPGRWDPVSETLLHFAARREHWQRVIAPALDAGRWVLCDRFADSTLAYQGHGQGVPAESVAALYALTVGARQPDLTLVLDLPVDLGLARTRDRDNGGQRYEAMDREFHERLRAGFLAIARAEPKRCVVIDARDAVETVHRRVLDALEACFGLGLVR